MRVRPNEPLEIATGVPDEVERTPTGPRVGPIPLSTTSTDEAG